eukprot:TRINITY_DN38474_c0_g1_i1.p1 TRINITY_DN38474_c0_g1~~TRINITY_DN38474_c0_g1_i1.p1  ORF type:complete len:218 (-),score=60.65 TRINITY_DN38474_c0_g1_i1:146-736(-)
MTARGELSRLILAQARAEYEDCRIERAEWPALKKTLCLAQLPVLEVEGKVIAQSMSIARYLARRFGLAGKTDLDAAEADQTIDAIKDLWNIVTPMMKEQDNVKRAEMKKKLETETLPNWLKMMETLLTSKGGIHFAGNQLTWADIAMYDTLELLKERQCPPDVTKCQNIKRILEKIRNLPNIQKWEKLHPRTGAHV